MLSEFGGGGHRGAGGSRFHVSEAEKNIQKIVDLLLKNEKND
jgi:nanoRNase/pAp phosphatase (c-di-AMP/oligoRNAs hydrolase)